jgi:hypothetical protein
MVGRDAVTANDGLSAASKSPGGKEPYLQLLEIRLSNSETGVVQLV